MNEQEKILEENYRKFVLDCLENGSKGIKKMIEEYDRNYPCKHDYVFVEKITNTNKDYTTRTSLGQTIVLDRPSESSKQKVILKCSKCSDIKIIE
jgi:hypothetical protein